ncbi:NAD(P)-binding protein [Pleomassaria siparia CBS 279.74]|uniref:NAD(P)-binding protein n=1 Tax=Pleomassaria siparia CBS 279.74 TaxID=1314801 RepID=A0A6G1KIG6_9PLEO|nr:NAD(P)-binding protein [Pleomassaria siparia CBS 279.74]
MSSYVITGVSRGLGWEFVTQLSSIPGNTVIGLVRNKAATDKRVSEELPGRANITILEADVTDYDALKKAAADTALITGGSLDYLFGNAAYAPLDDQLCGFDYLGAKPDTLSSEFHRIMETNVLGNIHLYNLFLPLILKGKAKKIISISSGMADTDLTTEFDIENAAIYSASKSALNMIVAKFSAQYKKHGVLFLGICPGLVETGIFESVPPEQLGSLQSLVGKLQAYAPHFKGSDKPPEAIKAVLGVVDKCSVEGGHGGAFLSHFGNKQWL